MALVLLLSDPNTPVRYGDLGRTVLQCLHVVHSMERSLSIFDTAISYRESEATSSPAPPPSQLLSAFDAHVGDCACQTRPLMLWDLVTLYRTSEDKSILSDAIASLKEIKLNTISLLWEIEQSYGKPRNPQLINLVTHLAISKRIRFTSFLELAAGTASLLALPITSLGSNPKRIQRSSHKGRDIAVDTDWNPRDFMVVARFLTLSYLLSDCKVATAKTSPKTQLSVRLDLHSMYEKNSQELEALQLTGEIISYRIKSQDGVSRMKRQCEAMQIYISKLTVDWTKQSSSRVENGNLWPSFPEDFIATNDRHIACVSSYLSFLLARATWVRLDIPILLVLQRFCSHGGYHNIYFRITKNPAAEITSKDLLDGIGEDSWFQADVVPFEDIISSSWGKTPHVILVGMSGQGTIEDFRQRLLASKQGQLQPQHNNQERCCEISDCELAVRHTNFSRVLAHCFAQHEQFHFRLPENEYDMVAALLRSHIGKKARDTFVNARLGAEKFGTGQSTQLFTIEHFFLEFPSVLGQYIKDQGDDPHVFGCKLELL